MIKFIIHIERGGKTSIMEVEIELVTAVEDPSVKWLPEGEYKARVTTPMSLYDKQEDGSLTPPVWYSHAFSWTIHQAWARAERMLREEFQRGLVKYNRPFSEEDVQSKLAEIQEILLP
jgi:hypothetical protein